MKARLVDDRADARERLRSLRRQREPEQSHRPRRWLDQAEEHPDQRRLPGPVRAQIAER